MEVHHHPDLHHNSKKWKEYFLEFIMIFLAVTLGFIAESIREHITNTKKEKQYIAGFIRNLRDDTASLQHVIDFDKQQLKGIDSMIKFSHANMRIDSNRKIFYKIILNYFYNSAIFKSNDATLQQLKSTGDYRLIEKDHVADSLTKYDNDNHDIYNQGFYYETYFRDILSRLDELTDMTILADTSYMIKGQITNKPLPLLRDENVKLPTLFNKIVDFRIITNAYRENDLKPQLENCKRLISYLRKEYEIEE